MTDYLIVMVVTLGSHALCLYAGWALRAWYVRGRTPAEVAEHGPNCAVCEVDLPKNTTRDAVTGGYRCGKHKGVAV